MDFTITDEQRALAEATKGVLARHGSPAAQSGGSARPQDHDARLWAALVELGVPALPWSEADGGLGGAWSDLALAATEVGRARLGVPLAETAVAGHLVARLADDALRAELLGALSEGRMLVVPALDEPGRSFDPIPHDVVAEETPEGWHLTGTKAPVRYAQAADRAVVTAVTPVGTGVFVVEVGDRESDSLVLEAAPATLLATGDDAEVALEEALALGGVVLCAEALGAMEEALRLTTEYLRTRKQFGVPLAAFQALTHRAADMYVELELARSATLFAAMVADAASDGEPLDLDAVRRCRVVVDKASRLVGQEAIQMHGGIGVTAEHPVGHLTARLTAISRTWGSTRQSLGRLGSTIADHRSVDVLG